MDAYQQQGQHHHFLRPPPPSTSDPYHHHHHPPQQQQQQPLPPQPPHPHHQQWYPNHTPPPPPPPQQWGPQPPPQPQYYHAPPHNQYPLPPPPPPPPSHYPPPPYAQPPNQDWGAQNWAHHQHQGWDYQAQTNEEDWAAKARAWADANKTTQAQQPQLGPPPVEQSHYHHEQYPNQPLPSPNYQQFQAHQQPVNPSQAVPPVGSDPSLEGHLHTGSDAVIQRQGNLPSTSVHQQEVPYSYSSVTGNGGGMPPMSNLAPHEGQNNIQTPPSVPLADQPLDFAPRFNHDNQHMQSSYSYVDPSGPTREIDTVAAGPSLNNWTAHYPPVPPGLPPVPQHDPAVVVPSGTSVPQFSSFPGSTLQPTVSSIGPQFSLSAVPPLHHNTVFSGNAFGIPSLSERPKKASVPNWLKEEIKKKVITAPSLDFPKEDNHSLEDEVDYRSSLEKGDQEDSKSVDSSRSAEEDEEDKDYEDAAKTAAINQEIKRILTEVLLKVTDELFDEIATKVLDESDTQVDKSTVTPKPSTSISNSTLPTTPKADSKPLIPGTSKEPETEGIIAKSISVSPGDLLGLADYATDDDDEDEDKDTEIQTLSSTNPNINGVDAHGSSLEEPVGSNKSEPNLEGDQSGPLPTVSKYGSAGKSSPLDSIQSRSKDIVGVVRSDFLDDVDPEIKKAEDNNQAKETKPDKSNHHENKKISEKDFKKVEDSVKLRTDRDNGNHKKSDEKHSRRAKRDKPNGPEYRRKEQRIKYVERSHESEPKKRSSHFDDKDDKHKRERMHKGASKDESGRKRDQSKDKDKDDERSRHKRSSDDSSRHKKRRSSSVSRGRNSKDNSGHRDNDTSDDASNDSKRKSQSRRRNFSPSPSPVKSKRRQVSRSPHSKHSLRRHSPYSSHETNRVRRSRSRSMPSSRSRSRSPVRRRRYD